jgi:hypothetical protein
LPAGLYHQLDIFDTCRLCEPVQQVDAQELLMGSEGEQHVGGLPGIGDEDRSGQRTINAMVGPEGRDERGTALGSRT